VKPWSLAGKRWITENTIGAAATKGSKFIERRDLLHSWNPIWESAKMVFKVGDLRGSRLSARVGQVWTKMIESPLDSQRPD
jgi:hypothetical protein